VGIWYCDLSRAPLDPSDECGGDFRFQHVAVKYPRTFCEWMVCFDLTTLDCKAEGSGTDAESVSGFGQVHPAL